MGLRTPIILSTPTENYLPPPACRSTSARAPQVGTASPAETDNTLANLASAAQNGLKHGAVGYLITDWGDNGHLQYLPISYLGLAAGAAMSWCLESNRNQPIIDAMNLHVFHDSGKILGRVAYDLGNVYQACGKPNRNGSNLVPRSSSTAQ